MSNLTRYASGALVLAAVVACAHGDPVSTAGGTNGIASVITGSPSSATLPSGTATSFTSFGGFTTAVRDAFGRKPSNATIARRTQYFFGSSSVQYWEWFPDVGRNASAAALDPRKPALQSATATIRPATGIFDLYEPNPASYPGGDNYWEAYTRFSGLKASTKYQAAFVQYRLKVNGQLDQTEMILTGAVTQPDSLIMTSGAVGYSNTDWQDDAGTGCTTFPGKNTNPFIFNTFTTDATGTMPSANSDKCWLPGTALWASAAEFDTQVKSMVGRNDDQPFALPNYNYIEVWEDSVGKGAGPALRIQIAQDMDLTGLPVANAFSPFPAPNTTTTGGAGQGAPAAVDQSASFPISAGLQATLPGAVGVPDSIKLTLGNLPALSNGMVYKVWYVDPVSGTAAAATGRYRRSVGGVVQADSADNTSTFAGGAGSITFTSGSYLTAIAPKTYGDSLAFAMVTIEASAGAATPSAAQPLWVKIFKIPPAAAGGTMPFGTFDAVTGGKPAKFSPQGTATGGVLGDTVGILVTDTSTSSLVRKTQFVGSVIEMSFAGLQRPPVGYQYEAFLRSKADPTQLLDIGGLVTSTGASLDDADTQASGGIAYAKTVYDAHSNSVSGTVDQICNYDRYRLYLVPKGADATPTTLVFDIGLPGRVTGAYSCR